MEAFIIPAIQAGLTAKGMADANKPQAPMQQLPGQQGQQPQLAPWQQNIMALGNAMSPMGVGAQAPMGFNFLNPM